MIPERSLDIPFLVKGGFMAHATLVGETTGRVHVGRALAIGAGVGVLWGIGARLWMRLIADDPAFSWGGTGYILGAAMIFGLTTRLASTARRNGWRPGLRRMASAIGGGSVILIGAGAGSITLPTIIVGGIVLGRPTIRLAERIGAAALITLVAALIGGQDLRWGIAVGAFGFLVLTGYRSRVVFTIVALAPAAFVVGSVLFDGGSLPMWQRIAGALLYLPVVAPLTIWFARTVSPLAEGSVASLVGAAAASRVRAGEKSTPGERPLPV